MKQFRCGDVIPGCTATFESDTEAKLLQAVALHAKDVHDLDNIPEPILLQVRSKIREVAA